MAPSKIEFSNIKRQKPSILGQDTSNSLPLKSHSRIAEDTRASPAQISTWSPAVPSRGVNQVLLPLSWGNSWSSKND